MDDPVLDKAFDVPSGEVLQLSPLVRRVLAPNAGPMTFTGTCSYIVGQGTVAVVDPGPDDASHLAALLGAVSEETVSHILVTHTHRDHTGAAGLLKQATDALIAGCAPVPQPEGAASESSSSANYMPDLVLGDGDAVSGVGWTLRTVATPGHTAGHLAFSLPEENVLFSGDHVMAWSTSAIVPPDGSMRAYLASLHKVHARPETLYWPGHGGPVRDPGRFISALIRHRKRRENAILARLAAGDETVLQIASVLYLFLAPALQGAGRFSILAHLDDLVTRGRVVADPDVSLSARYRLL